MLRGNRRYIVTAVLGLIAAIALGAGFQYLDYHESYHPPAERPAKAPANRVIGTARIANALESIRDDQQSPDASERGRRDLDAQEGAARWSKWAAWASIVQLFVSGVGLAALVYTLKQTDISLKEARRANRITLIEAKRARRESAASAQDTQFALDAARRSAEANILAAQAATDSALAFQRAERAHLVLKSSGGNFSEKEDTVTYTIIASNLGRSTAYVERIDWSGMDIPDFPVRFSDYKILAHPIIVGGERSVDITAAFESKYIGCKLTYRTVFSKLEYAYLLAEVEFVDHSAFDVHYTHSAEMVLGDDWPENS